MLRLILKIQASYPGPIQLKAQLISPYNVGMQVNVSVHENSE